MPCTGCAVALTVGGVTDVAFECQPPGFVEAPGFPGCFQNPILQFCSRKCALTYCASRCPCGGTCWKDFDLESLRAKPRGAWVAA